MKQSYTPSKKILEKYAELIVQFGLQNRNGEKLKPGKVVHFVVPEVAKPLYFYLQRAILKNGHHPLGEFVPSSDTAHNLQADFFKHANEAQRKYFLTRFHRAFIDQIDCTIRVLAETHHNALSGVDPKIIMEHTRAQRQKTLWRREKIDRGELNWTIVLYGTDAGAKEAGITPKEYWDQIIKACYLDGPDPIKTWFKINAQVQKTAEKLTKMEIKSIHVKGEDMDLTLGIGKDRKWLAGGGNNIPSYEVFTSPTWQEVRGWARLNQPLYRYGKRIEDIELWFENGKVVKSKAKKNYDLLKNMLKMKGGDKLGEFSLTDARLSRINNFMAETLYDENTGGKYGNTHIALGVSFQDCYKGKKKPKNEKGWDALGFNQSVLHSDIISTTNRTATATLYDGSEKVIYKNGEFTI